MVADMVGRGDLEPESRRPRSQQDLCGLSAAAVEHKGQPTVILAKTVKGYGMGEAGEGQKIAHQQKKMGEEALQGSSATASASRSPTRSSRDALHHASPRTARR